MRRINKQKPPIEGAFLSVILVRVRGLYLTRPGFQGRRASGDWVPLVPALESPTPDTKKAPPEWDSFRGAELQNLLKLFEALVNGELPARSSILSMDRSSDKIIY